jgi:hypothetical protein
MTFNELLQPHSYIAVTEIQEGDQKWQISRGLKGVDYGPYDPYMLKLWKAIKNLKN